MKHIAIQETGKQNLRQLVIKYDLFKHRNFVALHDMEKLIIRKPYQMEDKKTYIFSNNKSYCYGTIKSNIEPGKYLIDEEESTEDQIIIYYEDKI